MVEGRTHRGWTALAGLAFLAVMTAFPVVIARVQCPFQVNQAEAGNVELARLWAQGIVPYPDLSTHLALFSLYPPFYSLLTALLTPSMTAVFLPGRLWALAGFVGCAGLLLLWGWDRWGKVPALAFTSLFLLAPAWRLWGSMVRPDSLCLFLHFAAFLLLLRAEAHPAPSRGGDERPIVLAGLLAGAAFMVKQSAVTLSLVYLVYSLSRRQTRRLAAFAAGLILATTPAVLGLQAYTDDRYLSFITRMTNHGFDGGLLHYALSNWFMPEAGWLALAAGWVVVRRVLPGLLLLQLGAAALWLTGLGRPGSAENYMMEFELYGLFALAEGAFRPALQPRQHLLVHRLTAVFFITGVLFFLGRPAPTLPGRLEQGMKLEALRFYADGGEHLALDPDLPLMAGRRLWIPPAEYTHLVQRGDLSTEPLRRSIREQRFKTIELYDLPRQYLLPDDVVEEVHRHYRIGERRFGRAWWVPQGAAR